MFWIVTGLSVMTQRPTTLPRDFRDFQINEQTSFFPMNLRNSKSGVRWSGTETLSRIIYIYQHAYIRTQTIFWTYIYTNYYQHMQEVIELGQISESMHNYCSLYSDLYRPSICMQAVASTGYTTARFTQLCMVCTIVQISLASFATQKNLKGKLAVEYYLTNYTNYRHHKWNLTKQDSPSG